jgi:hypothetical protein
MAKFSYEQLSDAKIHATLLRDEGVLAMFGDRHDRARHCEQMIEHLGKLATALGYLIEPIQSGAVGAEAEAVVADDTATATASDFPTSSSHRGFAVEGQS